MLIKYQQKVRHLSSCFIYFKVEHVPREQNLRTTLLSKLATLKVVGFNMTIIQETLVSPQH